MQRLGLWRVPLVKRQFVYVSKLRRYLRSCIRCCKADFICLELNFLLGHGILRLIPLCESFIQLFLGYLPQLAQVKHRVFCTLCINLSIKHAFLIALVCCLKHLGDLLAQPLQMLALLLVGERFVIDTIACRWILH